MSIPVTAQARYKMLATEREPYLLRGRRNSELTLPSLLPPEGTNSATRLYDPYQSVGSKGVNHLASKLMLALFPPNTPFFRLRLSEEVKQQAVDTGDPNAITDIETTLARIERTVLQRIETRGLRSTFNEAKKHLVVLGNVLVELLEDGAAVLHPLTHYVVKRDREGTVTEIVIKEEFSWDTLPEAAQKLIPEPEEPTESNPRPDRSIALYTRIRLVDGRYEHHQEVGDKLLPGTEGSYGKDELPFLALRWTKIDGEDYGRGFIDDYYGDLRSVEGLSRSLVTFGAAASKVLIFVDDTGYTDRNEVAQADSGEVLDGRAQDLSSFQLDKYPDFQVVKAVLDDARRRLEEGFLLFSGLRRDAERVTAAEIRAIIQELEQALGGIYSVLSQELQLPLVRRLMRLMTKEKVLPKLPKGTVEPEIITGVEALGRANDAVKLEQLLALVTQSFGPDVANEVFRPSQTAREFATALGVDADTHIRSDEEIEQRRQEAMQMAALQAVGPQAIKSAENQGEAPNG